MKELRGADGEKVHRGKEVQGTSVTREEEVTDGRWERAETLGTN